MNLTDTQPLRGDFCLQVWRNTPHGPQLIEQIDERNMIVNGAKSQLARLIGGDPANRHINRIGFGVGLSPASPQDSALTGAHIKPLSATAYPQPGHVRFDWSLSAGEANGRAITEFGLICADGTLFARKSRAPIEKDADLSLTGSWTILF
ncbi:hypothetical protein [Stutzerimonas stutzeri]|uniref:hypothetical protein n=1 Tax=Stutzerimonas stutzeri TaxID=316 RepID=UPI00210C681B|nr:hypothetical protein [Stutzerimonas stutzeri]MCQ4319720.1 hypothetical protein [Stutzerimonas stutzeri]